MVRAGEVTVFDAASGVEAEADDGDARVVELRQEFGAERYRVVEGLRSVLAGPPEPREFRALEHDRRVDADRGRRQRDEFVRRAERAVIGVSVEAGHHLQAEFEAARLDEARSRSHVVRGVPAFIECQDPVVHALGAEFDGFHVVRLQQVEDLVVDVVGPGRAPDAGDDGPDVRLDRFEQGHHVVPVDAGEAPAEKGELSAGRAVGLCREDGVPDVVRRAGLRTRALCRLPHDDVLVAERALQRTADVVHEQRDVRVFLPRHLTGPSAPALLWRLPVRPASWCGRCLFR